MIYLALVGFLVCVIGIAVFLDSFGIPPLTGLLLGVIVFLAFTTQSGIWQTFIGPALKTLL